MRVVGTGMCHTDNAVVVQNDLPLEKLGPLGCGILTGAGSVLVDMKVEEGSSLVVFGAVGLAAVMAAIVVGAHTVIAVDLHRLNLARELGATHTFNGATEALVQDILAVTGGRSGFTPSIPPATSA